MSTGQFNASSPRIEELDVLRGLAIILVVAYHLPGHPVRGGLIGVDLFMVLSGYLVTTRLADATFSPSELIDFYRRRVRRILPPVAVVVTLCTVVVWAGPSLFRESRLWDLASSMTFVANWRFVLSGANYFNTVSGTSPVQHLWSLAIEEQFYLLWPLVMLTCQKRYRTVLVGLIAVGSMSWMGVHATTWSSSRLYFGTDTRIFALAIGSLLAIVRNHPRLLRVSGSSYVWPSLLAMYCVTAVLIRPDHHLMYRFGYQLLAMFGGLLVWESLARSRQKERASSVMTRSLAVVGVRSYSLYLVHWPVFTELTETRAHLGGTKLTVVQLMATALLSELLYRLVERRFANSRGALDRSLRVILPGGFTLAAIVAVAASLSPPLPAYLRGGIHHLTNERADSTARRVLVVGDSVVASLEPSLRIAAHDAGLVLDVTSISGCGILPGMTVGEDGAVYEPSRQCERLVSENLWSKVPTTKYDAVIWLNAWDAEDRLIDGQVLRQTTDSALLAGHFEEVVRRFASFAHIVFIGPVAPRAHHSSADPGGPSDYATRRVTDAARTIRSVAEESDERIKVIDLPELVCRGVLPCADTATDGTRFRPIDGIHFDGKGATIAAEYIVKQLTTQLLG